MARELDPKVLLWRELDARGPGRDGSLSLQWSPGEPPRFRVEALGPDGPITTPPTEVFGEALDEFNHPNVPRANGVLGKLAVAKDYDFTNPAAVARKTN